MSNHLLHENSPYLLQHADNPVEWFPYGSEAIAKARLENKPIFLSIGYAACHWCHVMERESFTDEETANLMNRYFINIKVDREERPDVDAIYMRATVALTGSGGWPMSVFLTPDLEPFFAGTYFPPEPRHGLPAFKDLIQSMGSAWLERNAEVLAIARQNGAYLAAEMNEIRKLKTIQPAPDAPNPELTNAIITAFEGLLQSHDDIRGGWGSAPKFPQPMALEFILRQLAKQAKPNQPALNKVTTTLYAMARGGMYDLIGGGFSRYSVDADWLVPHFEKMLYDNAQLALVYLHAFLLTRDPFFERVCRATLDFILAEMTDTTGGFYSSLDADSEGVEGKYYIWDYKELAEIAGEEFDLLQAACAVERTGNFEGKIILRRSMSDASLSSLFKQPVDQIRSRVDHLFAKLHEIRAARVRPSTDDKVLVSWNALAIRAFAEAGRYLREPKFTLAASKAADHILKNMIIDGELKRVWRAGSAKLTAYLEDHAALAWALTALYQSDPDPRWYAEALRRLQVCLADYADGSGGFFDTHRSASDLLLRPKDIQDNAIPSGSSLAACALLELSSYGDHPEYAGISEEMLAGSLEMMAKYPTGFGQWLVAASIAEAPKRQLALVLPTSADRHAAIFKLWDQWRPNLVIAINATGEVMDTPGILRFRPAIDSEPTLYLCENFVCELPTTDLSALDSP